MYQLWISPVLFGEMAENSQENRVREGKVLQVKVETSDVSCWLWGRSVGGPQKVPHLNLGRVTCMNFPR